MIEDMASALFTYQKAKYDLEFRSKKTEAFQDWFGGLARLLHPPGDVHTVRVTQGDGGLDVISIGGQVVYQCYAPNSHNSRQTVSKIKNDFEKAFSHLDGQLRKWVFVHNHPSGCLDKESIKALSGIASRFKAQNPPIEISAWGIEDLWSALVATSSYALLRDQFGLPDPVSVSASDIEALLSYVKQSNYALDAAPVARPSLRKLDFNKFGPAYSNQILQGRTLMNKVGEYLGRHASSNPEFAEQLAQRFRECYAKIRNEGIDDPDKVYEKLRLEAGWSASPDVQRELASHAIIAYFFESCDVFENPSPDDFAD